MEGRHDLRINAISGSMRKSDGHDHRCFLNIV